MKLASINKKSFSYLLLNSLVAASLITSPLFAVKRTAKEEASEQNAAKKQKSAEGAIPTAGIALDTDEKRISAALGEEVGKQIEKTLGKDLDLMVFVHAIERVLNSQSALLTAEEKQTAMKNFQTKVQKRMEAKAEASKKIGNDFLAQNKKKKGIKTTKSGLQYKVLKKGTGASPKPESEVTVHYEGKLLDGTTFDSSYARNEPANFKVNQVIPGWTEALTLMSVGSKWELTIPSELAYGPRDLPSIPANSVLLFTVELKSIKKEEPKSTKKEEIKKVEVSSTEAAPKSSAKKG